MDKYINQKKLAQLIKTNSRNIVNLKDDNFEYCDGHILAICDYEQHEVIQKLFKVGALSNYRNLTPKETFDTSSIINCKHGEVEAVRTGFLKENNFYGLLVMFKANGKYIPVQKKFVDIFENVTYKAENVENIEVHPIRVYRDEEFVGLMLPVRMADEDYTQNTMKTLDN